MTAIQVTSANTNLPYNSNRLVFRSLSPYWAKTGSPLPTYLSSMVSVTSLTENTIAVADDSSIHTYKFANGAWSLLGNTIPSNSPRAICALSKSRIVCITNYAYLSVYDFDGTNWSFVNSTAITQNIWGSIAKLGTSTIALYNGTNSSLEKYDYNGTSWSLNGPAFIITGAGTSNITALSATQVAHVSGNTDKISTYTFSGMAWLLSGNALTVSNLNGGPVATLSANRIALAENIDRLAVYNWDGTNWSSASINIQLQTFETKTIAALTNNQIVALGLTDFDIQTFDILNYGIPTILGRDTDTQMSVKKGNSAQPTSFSTVATLTNGTIIISLSGAMDSNNILHIAWLDNAGVTSRVMYVTYNCYTNTFGTPEIIIADIGDPPVTANLSCDIAVDSNNKPHIIFTTLPRIGGSATYQCKYINKVSTAWGSIISILGGTKNINQYSFKIAIGIDDIPVLFFIYDLQVSFSLYACLGNANNCTAVSEYIVINKDGPTLMNYDILFDLNGNFYVVMISNTIPDRIYVYKHAFGISWLTWTYYHNPGNTAVSLSATINNNTLYVFYEATADNDIKYFSCNLDTQQFSATSVLETGTFNTPILKRSLLNDNDSNGSRAFKAGRLDGSIGAGDASWVNPANLIDNLDTTYGNIASVGSAKLPTGLTFADYSDSEFPIKQIVVRVKQSVSAASATNLFRIYQTFPSVILGEAQLTTAVQILTIPLTAPTGGWTWNIVKNLVAGVYSASGPPTTNIYHVEFLVYLEYSANELDYIFFDETATPDVWWNILSLSIATSWLSKSLKWFNGASWIAKPLKYYNGSSWVTKPVKINM